MARTATLHAPSRVPMFAIQVGESPPKGPRMYARLKAAQPATAPTANLKLLRSCRRITMARPEGSGCPSRYPNGGRRRPPWRDSLRADDLHSLPDSGSLDPFLLPSIIATAEKGAASLVSFLGVENHHLSLSPPP